MMDLTLSKAFSNPAVMASLAGAGPVGWGAMAGMGALGGLGSMLGRASASNPYSSYKDQIQGLYNPWVNQGKQMGGQLQNQYSSMMSKPWQTTQNIGQHFQEDPGYQYAYNEAMRGGRNAFANNGLSGTPEEAKYLAEQAHGLADQGYNNYMNRNLGVMGSGLQGGENIMGRAGQANESLGQAAYGIKDWRNQQNQNMWGGLFGGASQMMPWMFGQGK